MVENNLEEISERLRNATPTDWEFDVSFDDLTLYTRRKNEKPVQKTDVIFFENAAVDIARLVVEVKQLRQINAALKRQLVNQEIDKDIRFL